MSRNHMWAQPRNRDTKRGNHEGVKFGGATSCSEGTSSADEEAISRRAGLKKRLICRTRKGGKKQVEIAKRTVLKKKKDHSSTLAAECDQGKRGQRVLKRTKKKKQKLQNPFLFA